MTRYSIKDNIVADIVGISKGELLPVERLYVAHNSDVLEAINKRWLVSLYMECGCFVEAEEIYTDLQHWRKLGDLCWLRDDLEGAFCYYSKPQSKDSDVLRGGPDWDRMIKLSVYREDWEVAFKLLEEAPISPGTRAMRIFLGNSEVSSRPYLLFYAIACQLLGREADGAVQQSVDQRFGIRADEWQQLLSAALADQSRSLDSARRKCLPRFPAKEQLTLPEASQRGRTARSEALVDFVSRAGALVAEAQKLRESFLSTGSDASLHRLAEIIDATLVESVTRTFLSAVVGFYSYDPTTTHQERFVRLYGCHPVMKRLYFAEYLRAKLNGSIGVEGADLLTGIFQEMSLVENQFRLLEGEETLDFRRLRAYKDWAETELDEWVGSEGKERVLGMSREWPEIEDALRDERPAVRYSVPSSPREMSTWKMTIRECLPWLAKRWESGIGKSQWKSEEQLFKALKKVFKGEQVIQHAQPVWLEPQHLDILIPTFSLAVEYMGEQHYRPVDFFGGQNGLKLTIERDKRKAEKCLRCGIKLVYVRHDEDMAARVREIRASAEGIRES